MKSGYKKPVKAMPVAKVPKGKPTGVKTVKARGTPSMMRKGKC